MAAHRAGTKWTLFDLAELGDPRVLDLAREEIATGNPDQRHAQLLGHMGDPAAIPLLREMYAKTRGHDRIQTFLAMEEIGAEDLDVFLRDAANDPDKDVREWAARRLAAQ